MLRWIMIVTTLAGFGLAFLARTPGLLGLGLVIGFISVFGVVFSIAGERISSNARPDTTMLQPDVIAAIRARAQAQAERQRQPTSGLVDRQN